jgi:hypothetical protein
MVDKPTEGKPNNALYSTYLEERKTLADGHQKSLETFDKTILTLASGAFGISISFINIIVPTAALYKAAVGIAWICFCISICITLISFLTSTSSYQKQIKILEHNFFGSGSQEQENGNDRNISAICTWVLNIVSLVSFLIGVILLAFFAFENLH